MEITPTQVGEAKLLPEVERSASKAFLTIPGLAFVADGRLTSAVEHERYIGLGTSWVARVNSQCLGFVCAERFGSDLHVWELSVHADAQRHGIWRGIDGACHKACAKGRAGVGDAHDVPQRGV